MNVVILFGFSGSGKSTIANLVGEKYGLRVVHPSGILRDLYEGKDVDIGNTRYNTGFWESEEGVRLFKNRLDEEEPLDVVSDRILLEEVKNGNVVIDSWSLPWLTDASPKIYLKADLKLRARRVAERSRISYEKALEIVAMKDEETRNLFWRLYGFDIKHDLEVFDLVVNTEDLARDAVFKIVCCYLDQ
ncbi:cytidylate kinase family protein [Candidatus Woesearchaeota archaeon]|nr:cytidylate kinase family protein [Candidatus Woesearchaeota archaeon]